MAALILGGLEKAIHSLEEAIEYALDLPKDIKPEIVRDSVIQRFEYTYELCWKLLQRWIQQNVSPEQANPRTKKDLFRLAAKRQLIEDPTAWFGFAEARNTVAHTYNEKNARYVYDTALIFLPAAKALYQTLKQHND